MDQLDQKIEALERKMDELQSSIDKLRKIFLWIIIITAALFILPLIGLLFVIPQFLSNYSSMLQ
jgi:type II secretory pathway component PulF